MYRLIAFFLFSLSAFFILPAQGSSSAFEEQAQNFTMGVIDEAFAVLKQRSSYTQTEYFDVMGKILSKYFAMSYIANFALGANVDRLNSAQKKEYLELFQEDALLSYATLLSSYSNEDLKLLGTKQQEPGVALVSTVLEMPDTKSTINLDWRVRQVPNSAKFFVIDILVAGVSLTQTKKSEFDSAIHNYKGDMSKFLGALQNHIDMLRRQNLKGFKAGS